MTAVLPDHIPDRVYRRPIITLIGGGDAITLDGAGTGYTLRPGSTGLGLAPAEVNTAPLPGGGSLLRSRRSAQREVFLPIDVHFGPRPDAYGLLEDARRRLENIITADTVEIRLLGKDGVRSVFGHYTEGLEGNFSKADVNHLRMHVSLKFVCPDPWWYGRERGRQWSLNRIAKPLVSTRRIPFIPIIIAPSVVNGAFEFMVSGDAPVDPVWTVQPPGEDLLIECANGCGKRLFMEGEITEPIVFDSRAEDITSPSMTRGELWDRMSLDSEFFKLSPGQNFVRVSMVRANVNSKISLSYREKYKAGH